MTDSGRPHSMDPNLNFNPAFKRSLSEKRIRPNIQLAGEPYSAYQSSPTPSVPLPIRSRKPIALDIVKARPELKSYFQLYGVEELIDGMELAKKSDLMRALRTYTANEIYIGLRFRNENALDFFDTFKDCAHSSVLECRRDIIGGLDGPNISQSHDSGYVSKSSPLPCVPNSSQPPPNHPTDTNTDERPNESDRGAPTNTPPPNRRHSRHQPYDSNRGSIVPSDLRRASIFTPASHSPIDPNKYNQPKDWACMYCGKEFATGKYCLNHETNEHSQKMDWTCPHCSTGYYTKNGCERHHKTHHSYHQNHVVTFPECEIKGKIRSDSEPRTACACPYCGCLFEGSTSFDDRSSHVYANHYKADPKMNKRDLDHSGMIRSLLGRQELCGTWNIFLANKGQDNVSLFWNTEDARCLLDLLETGNFHLKGGVEAVLKCVYDCAIKSPTALSVAPYDGPRRDTMPDLAISQPIHSNSRICEEDSSFLNGGGTLSLRALPQIAPTGPARSASFSNPAANARAIRTQNTVFNQSQQPFDATAMQSSMPAYSQPARELSTAYNSLAPPNDFDLSRSSSFQHMSDSNATHITGSTQIDVFMGYNDQINITDRLMALRPRLTPETTAEPDSMSTSPPSDRFQDLNF